MLVESYKGTYARNPYGATRDIADPRRERCWEEYIKLVRAGTPSAVKAALLAGYAPNTALQITTMKWFQDRKDKLRRKALFSKAERNLSRALDTVYTIIDKEGVSKINPDIMRIVIDVSKTIVATLGKDAYSTRVEQTGAGGKDLPTPILNILQVNPPIKGEITEIPNVYINDSYNENPEVK